NITCIGININTSSLSEDAAMDYLKKTEDELGLPCADPVRTGVGPIVDKLIKDKI
ncbi:MAG TPA: DUF1611 domain-containing protein, partial [Sphingomonadales bacterium]|nr:DUF1611 domain-containing protein [Sphingomonadales bacterium]